MQLKPGNFCPLIKKDCIGIKCAFFCQIMGKNPNTGEDVNEWNCSIAFLPMLLIENSQQTRQSGAAIENFRNEMVNQNMNSQQIFYSLLNKSNNLLQG